MRPDGSVGLDDATPQGTVDGEAQGHGLVAFDFHERVAFDALGAWRLRYLLGGREKIACTVTPSDGNLAARPASASASG